MAPGKNMLGNLSDGLWKMSGALGEERDYRRIMQEAEERRMREKQKEEAAAAQEAQRQAQLEAYNKDVLGLTANPEATDRDYMAALAKNNLFGSKDIDPYMLNWQKHSQQGDQFNRKLEQDDSHFGREMEHKGAALGETGRHNRAAEGASRTNANANMLRAKKYKPGGGKNQPGGGKKDKDSPGKDGDAIQRTIALYKADIAEMKIQLEDSFNETEKAIISNEIKLKQARLSNEEQKLENLKQAGADKLRGSKGASAASSDPLGVL